MWSLKAVWSLYIEIYLITFSKIWQWAALPFVLSLGLPLIIYLLFTLLNFMQTCVSLKDLAPVARAPSISQFRRELTTLYMWMAKVDLPLQLHVQLSTVYGSSHSQKSIN